MDFDLPSLLIDYVTGIGNAPYSGFTFRSNIPYAVQRKHMLCAYIHLYLKTRHKLPVYGIRNIRTERKSAVATI